MSNVTAFALGSIDLQLFAGKFFVWSGPSWICRSTLLNILGGLDSAAYGKRISLNHNLGSYSKEQSRELTDLWNAYTSVDITLSEEASTPLVLTTMEHLLKNYDAWAASGRRIQRFRPFLIFGFAASLLQLIQTRENPKKTDKWIEKSGVRPGFSNSGVGGGGGNRTRVRMWDGKSATCLVRVFSSYPPSARTRLVSRSLVDVEWGSSDGRT